MSEKFDPYHQWLGIPASEQPPHHYRLLAIAPFEKNLSVIEHAANQRMAHLRTFQTGKQSAESQRLLNEVAAAKICLLNPEKKTVYDRSLRARIAVSDGPTDRSEAGGFDPQLLAIFEKPKSSGKPPAPASRKKKSQSKNTILIATAVLTVVAVGFALIVTFGFNSAPTSGEQSKAGSPATSAAPAKNPAPQPPEPPKNEADVAAAPPKPELKHSDTKPEIPKIEPVAVAETKPEPNEVKPVVAPEIQPAVNDPPPAKPKAKEESVSAKKLAPPSLDEQKQLISEIDDLYKPSEAKDQAAKIALSHKLLDEGRKDASKSEQFVLFRRAGELARDAGDADVMLEAIDAIVAAGFDIQPYPVKAKLLKQLVAQNLSGASQLSTVIALCVKFAQEAEANGAIGEATDVLDAAKKSLPKQISQAQAALRAAKAAWARARTLADKTEDEKKGNDAQAVLDAAGSAQSVLVECAKSLQEARREHDAIQAAEDKLKTDPDDPSACLAVGRWDCFYQGDWDAGLNLLAKGSDNSLKSLAAEELASKPSKAEEKLARGDTWWDAAGKTKDKSAAAAMRRRAGYWYQEAMPDLSPGLMKSKVEKRLAQAADEPTPNGGSGGLRPPMAVAPFDEKTAKKRQAQWARYLGVQAVQTNSIGMKLVLIPPGEFAMGSSEELINEELRLHGGNLWYKANLPSEGPAHRVRVTTPYRLGATDVTQQEYEQVMGANPSDFSHSGRLEGEVAGQDTKQFPVERVSWDDAAEFCRRLSELPGEKLAKRLYALPTEAQWEYACRVGTTRRWYTGDDEAGLGDVAWFNKNGAGQTHPTAQKRPNAWGLYDMNGNVTQWCQDWYYDLYYSNASTDDPSGPSGGIYRVCRGGNYGDPAWACRSAWRRACAAGWRYGWLGFRVSLVPAEK